MRHPDDVIRLDECVAYWAQHSPDAIACSLNDTRLSYATLQAEIDRMAKALLAHGVRHGARVATLAPPGPNFLLVFLATSSIGAIWVGLNPRYQLAELRYVVEDSTPDLLFARTSIHGRSYAKDIAALGDASNGPACIALDDADGHAGLCALSEFLSHGDAIRDETLAKARSDVDGHDPCLIVYTSGSTGRPKGALLHHHGIARFATTQNAIWPVSPAVALNYFPINHVACVCDIAMPVLAAGGHIVFMEQFDAAASLALIEQERVTFWASVPSTFQMQLALPEFASFDLSSVQLIAWGGAAAPEPLIRQLADICPKLATNYAMTETMVSAAIRPTSDVAMLANCVGTAFPGVEWRLVTGDGQRAEQGEVGEILVRSAYNLSGYWQRPDATAEAFSEDGFFKTGDLGMHRPDGTYAIVGRLKEMYKSGGYNVYPREIEIALEAHPAVAMAAVVAIPDPFWQEVGVAYVVPHGALTEAELHDYCRAHLANFKVPKYFLLATELPLLPVGKLDKVQLRDRAIDRLVTS